VRRSMLRRKQARGGTETRTAAGVALGLLVLGAGLTLAPAEYARAEAAITGTEVATFSESFSDESFLCQEELYIVTVTGRTTTHFTFLPDTGAFHFHDFGHARVEAIPLDGTGTTYTGTFRFSDSENIRAVKHGDVLAEVDTDMNRAVAHGSDGSKAYFNEHAHFTVNANGEVSVQLHTTRMVCT
jgi:hypothetical protein